jgi:hypothetical protein
LCFFLPQPGGNGAAEAQTEILNSHMGCQLRHYYHVVVLAK